MKSWHELNSVSRWVVDDNTMRGVSRNHSISDDISLSRNKRAAEPIQAWLVQGCAANSATYYCKYVLTETALYLVMISSKMTKGSSTKNWCAPLLKTAWSLIVPILEKFDVIMQFVRFQSLSAVAYLCSAAILLSYYKMDWFSIFFDRVLWTKLEKNYGRLRKIPLQTDPKKRK